LGLILTFFWKKAEKQRIKDSLSFLKQPFKSAFSISFLAI